MDVLKEVKDDTQMLYDKRDVVNLLEKQKSEMIGSIENALCDSICPGDEECPRKDDCEARNSLIAKLKAMRR